MSKADTKVYLEVALGKKLKDVENGLFDQQWEYIYKDALIALKSELYETVYDSYIADAIGDMNFEAVTISDWAIQLADELESSNKLSNMSTTDFKS